MTGWAADEGPEAIGRGSARGSRARRWANAACLLAASALVAAPAHAGPTAPPSSVPAAALPAAKGAGAPTSAFDRVLELHGIRFHVSSPNDASINELRIVPSGLAIDNAPIARTVDGTVVGAEVADLNADGSPELYVFVVSAGSGSYGSLVAYSANRRKSLSEIYLPPIAQGTKAEEGYMGHDQFSVAKNRLVRRFPVYRPGDANAAPSGGMRELTYRLVPGEANWILKLDKVVQR